MNKPEIYFSGPNYLKFLLEDQKESRLPNWTQLSKIPEIKAIKKIVIVDEYSVNPHCLVWKAFNKLELYFSNGTIKYHELNKKEQIKDVQSGEKFYFILTKCGKVYSLASAKNEEKQMAFDEEDLIEIPLSDPQKCSFDELRLVTFFQEKNLFVESITIGSFTNYFLCKNGKLYGSGLGEDGKFGMENIKNNQLPILIHKNVSRVFTGKDSENFFFITTNNELFSCGYNDYGQLGIGNSVRIIDKPVKINIKKDLQIEKTSQILDLKAFSTHSILLTEEGKLYSCGCKDTYGIGENKSKFTQVHKLRNKKIIKIDGGNNHTLILTSKNELYGYGFDQNQNEPTNEYTQGQWQNPQRIKLPKYFLNLNSLLNISCGHYATFIYVNLNHSLKNDFKDLFESQKFSDSKLVCLNSKIDTNPNKKEQNKEISIPIHKTLIELRTSLKINEIQKIINENNLIAEEINSLLKWIYYDETINANIFKQIFQLLKLTYPPENTLKQDLLKLFKDEDSKDFFILVKDDDDDDDEEDEGENEDDDEIEVEEEEIYEELPVHKLILIARCGLFRDMFDNINEIEQNIHQIKDYSGKSIESLEILIKYLYTNKIVFTGDDDVEFIKEELSDSVEYYQLNENSNLIDQLNKNKNNLI
ncbi:btk-binding protein-related [Anaeramoeba flamelloides]|uniref:Btk-binding protein-related n=1 Tax=Anaeramoeba flamelloides TaxID=1746091 RepID=A0AAV7ZV93_9EUKA|nr:btk-binding protein-related [Anaeramoeba flamelloides]